MKRILKNIGAGILKGLKDAAPIPTKEMESGLFREFEIDSSQTEKDLFIRVLTEKLTASGVFLVALIYLADQIFKFGLFV